jgi:signal transduction histidine kinase
MANGSPYYREPEPPWWRVTRGNAWHKFNALLAIAIGVYVIGFQLGATYDWLSERTLIFFAAVLVFAIAGGIALGWVQEHRGAIAGTWATLGAVYMVFALDHAAGDSTTQRGWSLPPRDAAEVMGVTLPELAWLVDRGLLEADDVGERELWVRPAVVSVLDVNDVR